MKKIVDLLREHPFFKGLDEADLDFIAGCAKNVAFNEQEPIVSQGDPADTFYLIREGSVAVTIDRPAREMFTFYTLGKDDIVGFAWLIPPYKWTHSAHAVQATRALAIDGACLREKCEREPRLGYTLMQRLVQALVARENAARMHLLDIYGEIKK